MAEKILIIDFGSKHTQLIARRVRACNVYCEIHPCLKPIPLDEKVKGVILSGSPYHLEDTQAPKMDIQKIIGKVPILAIEYSAKLAIADEGGVVNQTDTDNYAAIPLQIQGKDVLFEGGSEESSVWINQADTIQKLPAGFQEIATVNDNNLAAFKKEKGLKSPFYGVQFHPEVLQTGNGLLFIKNFLIQICHCSQDWTPKTFVENAVKDIREEVGDKKVIMALSGGVDSTVTASLLQKAVGNQLTAVFVDHGLLRKNEFESVQEAYKGMGLNVIALDAKERYYKALEGVKDPEEKRKIIGSLFIDIFQEEADKVEDATFLGQGTIYPDIIESFSVHGPSSTIKSHHNVGGLPEKMNLKLIEPLKYLFKDEVRKMGKEIGVDESFLKRHPFPGPGLGIRLLGNITSEKIHILQEADAVFMNKLKSHNLYEKVWQAAAILLPVQSVGVSGHERTYEYTVALRAVHSIDAMSAEWVHLPYEFLDEVSNAIIQNVKGVNRVVYDISSKPPATIEWE